MKRNGFVFAVFAGVFVFAFTGCDYIQDFLSGGERVFYVNGPEYWLDSDGFANGEDGSAIDVIGKHADEAEVKIRLKPG
jgi:hypothetical protein